MEQRGNRIVIRPLGRNTQWDFGESHPWVMKSGSSEYSGVCHNSTYRLKSGGRVSQELGEQSQKSVLNFRPKND